MQQTVADGSDAVINNFFLVVADLMDLWLILSVAITLTLVQLFKGALKHYVKIGKLKWDPFTVKATIFVAAFIIGYNVTCYFLGAPTSENRKLAVAVAFLNPAIYEILCILADRFGLPRFAALLRMEKYDPKQD